MSNSPLEKAKIQEITSRGLWSISPNGFYVEISLEINDDKEESNEKGRSTSLRLIDQEELSSIYIQINISNSSDDIYEKFKNIYTKMLSFLPIVKLLTSYGVLTSDITKGKKFSSLKKIFDIDFASVMTNSQNISFFMHSSDFKKIGDIFHMDFDDTAKFLPLLDPYIKSIIGRSIEIGILNDFLQHQTNDEFFDKYKLGFNFYNYLIRLDTNVIEKFDISEILNSPNEKCRNFPSKLTTVFNNKNLLLIKVSHPIHCYHCILSISKIISSVKNCPFIFNRRGLIFCQKDDNFSQKIKEIKKTSENLTYFIVHPEFLNENDRLIFNEFIISRLNSIDNTDLPKILIISAKNYRDTFFMHQEKINICEFKIDNDLIGPLYNLSLADKDKFRFQLYYSDIPGIGKSHQIRKDFEDAEKCIFNGDHFLKDLFIDASTTTIPNLTYCSSGDDDNNNDNNEYKNSNYVHFDFSPDLFSSNSYRFFDELWTFCMFENHVNPDGSSFKTPQNIFFEVPLLDKVDFSNGKSFSNLDFPIGVHRFNQISIDDVDEIRVSEKVKTFCDKIFKDDIEFVSQLIRTTAKMFFDSDSFILKEKKIVSRLLNQFSLFVDYFVSQLSEEDNDENIALFILLLRTNFHIWKMDSIFENEFQLKSFIILAKESLLSTNHDDTKWILLNFISEGESFKWNTNCLKNNIKNKLEDVQDSNLFESNLFKVLKDNDDLIIIFSNAIDYENSQAYLFNIIQMYFYQNSDEENEYCNLINGVILNKIKNSSNYDNIRKRFDIIIYGKEEYNKEKMLAFNYKWNSVFEKLKLIYERYNQSLNKLVNELTDDEDVEQISKIELSINIVKRFVTMLIRIILNQSTIFEGSTGVGKTTTMNLFNLLVNKAQMNEDFNWRYHQVDCSIDFKVNDFVNIKQSISYQTGEETKNHIFFCDNLNTSPILHYIINEINKYNKVENGIGSSVFIAAINPYETVSQFSQNLSLVGLKQKSKQSQQNNLIYDVIKLPEAAQFYVIKSDPEVYIFNEQDKDYVDNEDSEYLAPEEFHIIRSIVSSSLYSLTDRINNLKIFRIKNKDKLNNDNLKVLKDVMINYKDDIADIFSLLLKKAFSEMRRLIKFKSVFSYRDVNRCMVLFNNFLRKLANISILASYDKEEDRYVPISDEDVVENIIPQAIVLSIMLSIVFRFSNDSKVELSKNAEYSLFIKYGLENTINIRPNLVKELSKVNWPTKKIKQPSKDWNKIVKTYAWLKCSKYIYKDFKNKKENANLLKTNSLILNLFAISSCYSASKNNKENVLPCIIIGPTGSSKTLAFKLFSDYKLTKNKLFYSTTYLSSQHSTSKKLMAQYRDCAGFMAHYQDSFSICSIENFNISNLKDKSSVQALHYFMDKGMEIKIINKNYKKERKKQILVMPYITTCYSLDYATMNRAILIYNEIPSDKEIAKAFCISESESKSLLLKNNKLKNKFFEDHKIFKLNETVHKEKYKNFLSILWKLTPNKKRPECFPLQPLYLFFNSLFHNNKVVIKKQLTICAFTLVLLHFAIHEIH